jgi:hypothetical protein
MEGQISINNAHLSDSSKGMRLDTQGARGYSEVLTRVNEGVIFPL